MEQFIGCDAHQKYSVFVTMDDKGRASEPVRVDNNKAELRRYLCGLPKATPVALETSGSWYWLVDELEAAGLQPRLVDAKQAKQRMGGRNKTDALDALGLAMLLRNGTLPTVWIPNYHLRDLRGLLRTRLAMRRQATFLKNRLTAAVRRYGLREDQCSDLFAGKGRLQLSKYLGWLPTQTQFACLEEWALLDQAEGHIEELEKRIREKIGSIGWVRLLKSLPGVGEVLGATLWLEIGDVERFPTAEYLASYAGLTPTVHSSGGKTHMGPTSKCANHYLRWAYVEAANCIVRHKQKYGHHHVGRLYERIKTKKCTAKAKVAVGRHLAEASWWILTRKQVYREPAPAPGSFVQERVNAKAV
jgi:transposase